MTWQTPKTNWAAGVDVPTAGAFNRIEKNISLLRGGRTATTVVGHEVSGHTLADCDLLCDGVNDHIEINQALAYGGRVVLLEGVYNVQEKIFFVKDNSILQGQGKDTILKRMWDHYSALHIINIHEKSYCEIRDLQIDGNKEMFAGVTGIFVSDSLFSMTNVVSNNGNCGIHILGMSDLSRVTLINCDFCNNNTYGVITATGKTNLIGCTMINNNINDITIDSFTTICACNYNTLEDDAPDTLILGRPEPPTLATPKNGWTNQSNTTYGAMRYYVDRDRFYLYGVLRGVSATNDVCYTIPSALRPINRKLFPAFTMAGEIDGAIKIQSNGNVEISSRSTVVVDISYRIGT